MLPRPALPLLFIVMFVTQGMNGAFAESFIRVTNENGLLSIKASNTTASKLADVLTEQLGISIVVTGDTEKLINIDIIEEPLDKALSKLNPNNMLIRASKAFDSDITEVVLIMGDGGSSEFTNQQTNQFLPSAAPTDANGSTYGRSNETPPYNATQQVQSATGGAAAITINSDLAEGQTGDYPLPDMFDPISGVPIDPITGLPLQQR